MNSKEMEEQIITNYQRDEAMMVLVFAQWCINNDLNPVDVYMKAYPTQTSNHILQHALDLVVPKEESDDIPNDTLLAILSLFGNEDLAFIVTEEINKQKK